jgi:hypothetical protein
MGVRITRGQRLGNNHAARFALAASLALASTSAMADSTVGWLSGSYSLSDSPGGPTTSTLNVSETAGLTTFHVTGEDNETFSISNAFQPLLFSNGAGGGFNMVVPTAALASESWSASQYPFINFYSQQGRGRSHHFKYPRGQSSQRSRVHVLLEPDALLRVGLPWQPDNLHGRRLASDGRPEPDRH